MVNHKYYILNFMVNHKNLHNNVPLSAKSSINVWQHNSPLP